MVSIGPFQNLKEVHFSSPFLLITGTIHAPGHEGENLGGATGGDGVLPIVTEVPDFDVTAFDGGNELVKYYQYQGVNEGLGSRGFGYVSIFYDIGKIFTFLRLAGIQHNAFVLHTNINVSQPESEGVFAHLKATVYAGSTRKRLQTYQERLLSDSLDNENDPADVMNWLDIDGGAVARQPHSNPAVPLVAETDTFRQEYPTDGPFVGDLAGPYIRAGWRWDYENRNLPPFSPPDFGTF